MKHALNKAIQTLLCTGLVVSSAGCFLFGQRTHSRGGRAAEPPADAMYKALPGAPQFTPVAAAQVSIYSIRGRERSRLPEGISVRIGRVERLADRLLVSKSYPSAQAPHKLLGGVAVARSRGQSRRGLIQVLAAKAGQNGANAIVVVKTSHRRVVALAMRISSARPVFDFPSARGLLSKVPTKFRDRRYRPMGRVATIHLGAPKSITIQGRRGRCYAVHLAFASNARLTRAARRLLRVRYKHVGSRLSGSFIGSNLPLDKRSHAALLGCPTQSGVLRFRLAGRRNLTSLGSGQVRLKIYRRAISEGELAARALRRRMAIERSRRATRASIRKDCYKCKVVLMRCRESDPARCRAYRSCLSRHFVRVHQCNRH